MFDNAWTRFNDLHQLAPSSEEAPVFLLAAGWRSGSTLLQRIVASSGDVLMWGEPYGRSGLIPSMTRTAMSLRTDRGETWPAPQVFAPDVVGDVSESWIANFYPPPDALKRSMHAQLDALLSQPARDRGFARWGLKEVRLHGMDAQLLAWLYPNARFLFQFRNPWDAWASAKGGRWWLRWPDRKVETAAEFANHWRRLVQSFLEWPSNNGMLVRYEDLIQPTFDLEQIREHCGLSGVRDVRATVVRGMSRPPMPLTELEVAQIARGCGELASSCGYDGPSAAVQDAPRPSL